MTIRIGISAFISHPDPNRQALKNKTLCFVEQSLLDWVMRGGAIPCMLPPPTMPVTSAALIDSVDGLLLPGGPDIAPQTYGEAPANPAEAGDASRDAYELALIHTAFARCMPIFGVCRGLQLLNVALGGDVRRDVDSRPPGALVHSDAKLSERLEHDVTLTPGSHLAALYGNRSGGRVNSVHHQAVGRISSDLAVEAQADDGVVEALRGVDRAHFLAGVQWHPEFLQAKNGLLDAAVLREDFFEAVRKWRAGR